MRESPGTTECEGAVYNGVNYFCPVAYHASYACELAQLARDHARRASVDPHRRGIAVEAARLARIHAEKAREHGYRGFKCSDQS